jgi:hypothetical protein
MSPVELMITSLGPLKRSIFLLVNNGDSSPVSGSQINYHQHVLDTESSEFSVQLAIPFL